MESVGGKGIFPGIVIGKPYIDRKKSIDVENYKIPEDKIEEEIERLKGAIESAKLEIKQLKDNLRGKINKEDLQILTVHLMMLDDPQFTTDIKKGIKREMVNAESIVKKVSNRYIEMFEKIADPIYKQRALDIKDISERIINNLVFLSDTYKELDGRILVVKELFPSELLKIYYSGVKLSGIIMEYMGETSHIAILAKSLELPTLMGGHNLFEIEWGDLIILDTSTVDSKVITNPDASTLEKYLILKDKFESKKKEVERNVGLPTVTVDGVRINLSINIGGRLDITEIERKNPDGIGLLRTELIYMDTNEFPSEDKQFKIYDNIGKEFGEDRPIIIRTLDIGADKKLPYYEMTPEENPSLGCRGIRFTLKNKNIFKDQIKAILRAAYGKNIKMMYPMVTTLKEVFEARGILEECKRELREKGIKHKKDLEVGVMIEVPSAVILADVFAQYVDFFSVGTNDLTQYILATDRFSQSAEELYDCLDPAVLRGLNLVAKAGREYNKKVSICGEMAGDEISVLALLSLGITELSMTPPSIPKIRALIRKINLKELQELKDRVLKSFSSDEVRQILLEYMNKIQGEQN
ncbi:phosphoenolpyruvate--protein phosphotransferase [Cetobacterium sp. 2A]|uniref:phosphoenolpyruvate--protein phosphotransferase n=1 Tax=Cetobacterium sp. 2A TaxID=2754723 RepID=UPI00163CB2B3|nr:phosphoenolpyruvate--protein phosphotransferase [Cetobacterium sp. 2A]